MAIVKPFAILMLNKMRVVHFDTKDEMIDAMKTCKAQDINCLAFRWYQNIQTYVQMEEYS